MFENLFLHMCMLSLSKVCFFIGLHYNRLLIIVSALHNQKFICQLTVRTRKLWNRMTFLQICLLILLQSEQFY